MLSYFHNPTVGTPAAIRMPYSMYDNGKQMAGEGAGWLGAKHDPVLLRTPAGKAYAGVNRYSDKELNLKLNLSEKRVGNRNELLEQLEDTLLGELVMKPLTTSLIITGEWLPTFFLVRRSQGL